HWPGRAIVAIWYSGCSRQTWRGRQPARSFATAHGFQGFGGENAERNVCENAQSVRHGPQLRAATAWADDHGAVATRRFYQVGPIAKQRQHPVSCTAAFAR